jgi:hypothetical protein
LPAGEKRHARYARKLGGSHIARRYAAHDPLLAGAARRHATLLQEGLIKAGYPEGRADETRAQAASVVANEHCPRLTKSRLSLDCPTDTHSLGCPR